MTHTTHMLRALRPPEKRVTQSASWLEQKGNANSCEPFAFAANVWPRGEGVGPSGVWLSRAWSANNFLFSNQLHQNFLQTIFYFLKNVLQGVNRTGAASH